MIKDYFDKYRNVGKLPPELEGRLGEVRLFDDQEKLTKWRNWRSALVYDDSETGAFLSGMLDDLGVLHSGKGLFENPLFVPLDYKTRGFDVKEGGENFYKNQMNCYGLLLRENNMKPAGYAYLLYYIPKEVSERGTVRFDVVPKKVEIDPDEALKVFRAAVNMMNGPMPETHSTCEYCAWGNDFLAD